MIKVGNCFDWEAFLFSFIQTKISVLHRENMTTNPNIFIFMTRIGQLWLSEDIVQRSHLLRTCLINFRLQIACPAVRDAGEIAGVIGRGKEEKLCLMWWEDMEVLVARIRMRNMVSYLWGHKDARVELDVLLCGNDGHSMLSMGV